MILVLTGAPGAGKGTQADLLAERCGYHKLSTGDALRKHVKLGTEIGKKAEAIMERGELVPDDVLFQILKEELGASEAKVTLLDGYPRNVSQAETLETLKDQHPVAGAIHLDVDREDLIERLSGRRVCSQCGATYHVSAAPPKKDAVCDQCGGELIQRSDDKPDSVATRLDVYEKNTAPVLDFYKERGLYHRVDGSGSKEEIFERLKAVSEKAQS